MDIELMKKIKDERGYSLKRLAAYSGVPAVTLQKIFSGETTSPRKATLDAIEKVLLADEKVYIGKAYEYANSTDKVHEASRLYSVDKVNGEYTIDDLNNIPSDISAELIDGTIYYRNAPSLLHQDICFFFQKEFFEHITKESLPCKVYSTPHCVQLNQDDKTMIQPDISVLCDVKKLRKNVIWGAPDLVIEVLSPSTRRIDLTLKCHKYCSAKVREYWIVDPEKKLLIKYDFTNDSFIPELISLKNEVSVGISPSPFCINLSPLLTMISFYEEIENDAP